MLSDLLNETTVRFSRERNLNWEKAISEAAQPLLENHSIQDGYITSMIDVVKSEGPYINIGPKIALAHAQPNGFVNRVGMSMLKTQSPIALTSSKHMVCIWFVLAATDTSSHLDSIKQLTKLLTNSGNVEKLLSANSVKDLLNIINQVE